MLNVLNSLIELVINNDFFNLYAIRLNCAYTLSSKSQHKILDEHHYDYR